MARKTLKHLRVVAPLPLHYQLHFALSRALLLYPHMRNERRPPFLAYFISRPSADSSFRFRRDVGPGVRITRLMGLLSASGARPRVASGDDDAGSTSVPARIPSHGCYNNNFGLGLACEGTQHLLHGAACGRHVVEALAERRSRREEAVERGSIWACDILAKTMQL